MEEYSDKILLTFNKSISFIKNNREISEEALAIEYNGMMFVANKKYFQPKERELCLVFLPKDYFKPIGFYAKDWRRHPVFAVKVIPVETIIESEKSEKIIIIKDVYLSKEQLKKTDDDLAKILIRGPNNENPNTHLIFVKIKDKNWRELFWHYYQKQLDTSWTIERVDNLIELKVNGGRTLPEIKKQILSPFEQCYFLELKPET